MLRLAAVIGAGCAVVIAVAVLVVKLGPEWLAATEGLDPADAAEERGRVRTALLAILAGAVAAVGAIYTARSFELNRRGQITERFTRAIDQLGHENIDVRLGGIYALERIAHESREEHGPIMEVLTTCVREHSPWPPKKAPETEGSTEGGGVPDEPEPPVASVDVKAVLTVLARRNLEHERGRDIRWNLSRTNLRGIAPGPLRLPAADLEGAQLQGARLEFAQLPDADLVGAQLQGARLEFAQLRGARLEGAQLQGAELMGAQLERARLDGAALDQAQLYHARLQGARLTGAVLRHAYLGGANLEGVIYDGDTIWPEGFEPPPSAAPRA